MNQGYAYYDIVPKRFEGARAIEFYAASYPNAGPPGWLARMANGQVTREGEAVAGDTVLRAGDRLSYFRPPWEEPAVPTEIRVVFEDDDLLVIDKPVGLPVQPGGGHLQNTAVWIMRNRIAGAPLLSPIHRLDRGASGLLMFGKNERALSALGRAMRARSIHRFYLAVLQGIVERDAFTVEAAIGRVPHPRIGLVWAASAEGKPSRSEFRVLDRDATSATTLVEVALHTGRTRQIRIHAAAAGHPLAGEPFYAVGGLWDSEEVAGEAGAAGRVRLPSDMGFRLHARRLEFAHPRTGVLVSLQSNAPSDFWGGSS
jgi:23S rRNA pseudouridine1911/1915/1917 synthase